MTTANNLVPRLMPMMRSFQHRYPQVRLQVVADRRQLRLEHVEAHIGIRPGAKPTAPDYVVQAGITLQNTLYASKDYIRECGPLKGLDQLAGHRFIGTIEKMPFIPYIDWVARNVPDEQVVFRCNEFDPFEEAALRGVGIAPLPCWRGEANPGLQRLLPPPQAWQTDLWLVTHRDMHRTRKVQLFLEWLKRALAELPAEIGIQR